MHYRSFVVPLVYLSIYTIAYFGAYVLRFEFEVPTHEWRRFGSTLLLVLFCKTAVAAVSQQWRRKHRYTNLIDLFYLGIDVLSCATLLWIGNAFLPDSSQIPRSIIVIDMMLTAAGLGSLRSGIRLYCEIICPRWLNGDRSLRPAKRRAMIYGSDASAVAIMRALRIGAPQYRIRGFLDPNNFGERTLIGAAPVYDARNDLQESAMRCRARMLLIPASIPGKIVRELVGRCQRAGLTAHVIPGVDEIVAGRYRLEVRDVTISDLLRREPTQLDFEGIRGYITGKSVLVTGAAGSIGSELCRQIRELSPERLVLLDQSESGVFAMEQEFLGKQKVHAEVAYEIADIRDTSALREVMARHKPDLVFHAAAYKHVPLMEANPQEAIRNNVMGTKALVDVADEFGVERFVLVSTDKAVRPKNVMGSTKLIAEKYLQAMAQRSKTQFMTVRFGNVLNSVGSVVPTFRRQIQEGGPITVTHPDMVRFFMTIPEAVQLVLQAGAVGESGSVMILDMGEPVKIVDLARDMIYLSGLKHPDDIDIVFTGLRPGEKLYEELFYETETSAEKVHEKIFLAHRSPISPVFVKQAIAQLQQSVDQSETAARRTLAEITAQVVAIDEGKPQTLSRAA